MYPRPVTQILLSEDRINNHHDLTQCKNHSECPEPLECETLHRSKESSFENNHGLQRVDVKKSADSTQVMTMRVAEKNFDSSLLGRVPLPYSPSKK